MKWVFAILDGGDLLQLRDLLISINRHLTKNELLRPWSFAVGRLALNLR
jgi:hypothetical protein